ncbi:MAG: hypothetical protein IPQ07_02895 [Myxococcales bacterium]|nr:hypothetical protein [Myxococcales bacterium]
MKRILDGLDLRVVIAVHLVRIPIGALFLWEHAAGRLPATFAYRAGLGDIAVGVLAIGAIAAVSRSRLVLTWSIVGLVDIVLVLVTAQYLVLVAGDPLMLAAFSRLPYPLLPTLVVPVVIATHILVIARCRAAPSAAGQSTNSG